MTNPERFLGRAEVYAAARPNYPEALGQWLLAEKLLGERVADIGAGTGLFTRLLLQIGATVDAVEPNSEMRAQLQVALHSEINAGQLTVHGGTSENTGLPDQSVVLVTAAQAAHWFTPEPTVREFQRILKPAGHVLLVWNDWRGAEQPFNQAYGQVVRQYLEAGTPDVATRVPEAELPELLPYGYSRFEFDNPTELTRERLHALAGSVSYLPAPTDPLYQPMTRDLDTVFDQYQQHGRVELMYRTFAFLGQLHP